MSQTQITAAVIQAASVGFNLDASLDKAAHLTQQAAQDGAKLVVFPEAGAKVGFRTSQGRAEYRRYWESAIDLNSEKAKRLAQIAKDNEVYLVMGVIERDGSTLYCTVVFYDPTGTYLGKHRKLMPTASERIIWGMGDGSTMPVLETSIGRIGAVICWENYMPLLRMHMYAQGIQIYCAPTADDLDSWIASMQHIAREGRCFVLSSCQYLKRSDMPNDIQIHCDDEILMRGGSCIIDPLGNLLAGPNYEGETILQAKLDLHKLPESKYDFDVVGHYSRPDIFQLTVNRSPQRTVVENRALLNQISLDEV